MKQRKMLLVFAGIVIVFALLALGVRYNHFARSGDVNSEQSLETINQESEAEAVEKAAVEKAEREREEAKQKAEEEAKRIAEDIATHSYYVGKDNANVYASVEAAQTETPEAVATLSARTKVYVSEYVKNDQGVITYGVVKSTYDAVSPMGVVVFTDLVKSLSAFITHPYEDADYSAFAKGEVHSENPPVAVKGIYVTGPSASTDKIDALIDLIDRTELNAMVIDVKDDNGRLLFYSETAEALNPSANEKIYIDDIEAFIEKLKAHDIYLIARIVTFKSPIYAKANPDQAITYKNSGELYSDADGLIWASAYNQELWDYNVGIAAEAAAVGFNEIQFDYVRFPAISNKERFDFKNDTDESQAACIQNFLKYAYTTLSPMGVYVSADVFGWAATAVNDVGIGQHWEALANVIDYVCPMMYPSHYGPNNFGLSVPDAYPYETIDASIQDAIERNGNIETPALIRPWIQDFTATWVKGHISYGAEELRAQIQALEDNGIDEYLIWNSRNNYSEGGLTPAE